MVESVLKKVLSDTIDTIDELKSGYQYHRELLTQLQDRLTQQNLYLAVVGQVKRGKSTLLNALIGEQILPASIIPVTAIPTFLKYSELMKARVVFLDSTYKEFDSDNVEAIRNFLSGYIVEKNNPKNHLNVSYVEVLLPSSLLKDNIVLIDTPGIGSTYLHNTETTLNFLPQCDAALFVTSVDPPITEVEQDFLRHLSEYMGNVYFVLNKIDYLSEDELSIAKNFMEEVLRKNGFNTEIFLVSAKNALMEKRNKVSVKTSNIEKLEMFIVGTIANRKKLMIEKSLSIKTKGILQDIVSTIDLEIKSLEFPLEEIERRFQLLKKEFLNFEREKDIIQDSLEGERKRLHDFLEDYCDKLKEKAKIYLESIVKENAAKVQDPSEFYEISRQSIASAIPVFFEHENGQVLRLFDKKIVAIVEFYNEKINQLLDRIRDIVAQTFESDFQQSTKIFTFEMTQKPYWLTHVWLTGFQPLGEDIVDRLLPFSARMKKIDSRIQKQVEQIIMENVENLRWSVFQSIDKFFIAFKNFFEKYFTHLIQSISGLVEDVLKEKQKKKNIDREIIKLKEKKKRLIEMQAKLD